MMERQVAMIEPTGSPVEKRPLRKNDYNPWAADVVYTFEDGTTLATVERFSLKRDAVAFVASLPKRPDHRTVCRFDDAGTYTGRSTSYWIGPRDADTYAADGRS